MEEEQKSVSRSDGERQENGQKTSPPEPPFLVGCLLTSNDHGSGASHRNFMQADVLDCRPDNSKATGFCGEHVNLIGALPHIAEQTLNGIGGLNVSMHGSRELVKRQQVLFIL